VKVSVLFFAGLRASAGTPRVEVKLPADAKILDLRRQLTTQIPRAAGLIERSLFAVGNEYMDDLSELIDGMEVAVIPPVSGG